MSHNEFHRITNFPLALLTSALAWATMALAAGAPCASAQAFLEYPGHSATYGDHVVNTSWTGGPSSVLLTFESDESILHGDGIGQSQRTARNTLSYVPPSDPSNPQNYDDLALIGVYGDRLPLLQQMSANGTSTLRFEFAEPVNIGFDVFVTDVDTADDLVLRAYGIGGVPIDMTSWSVVAEGDLSLYKDTGTEYSDTIAPVPNVTFQTDGIGIQATDATNYNRSYSILRAPTTSAVTRFEIEFMGIQNSPSRAQGGTGSHVYVGLCTVPETSGLEPDAQEKADMRTPHLAMLSVNPGRGPLRLEARLAHPGEATISLFDTTGRRLVSRRFRALAAGTQLFRLDPPNGLAHGVYRVRLDTAGGSASVAWVKR